MFCGSCGVNLPSGALFCNRCGGPAPQEVTKASKPGVPQPGQAQPAAFPEQPAAFPMQPAAFPEQSVAFPVQPAASPVQRPNAGCSPQHPQHPQHPQNQPIPLNTELLASVPYKSNGEPALFFEDHVEFAGNTFKYCDIAVMDTRAVESTGYALIFWWGDFSGHIRFTLANGYQAKIKVYGFNFWSVGGKRSARKRWPPLFGAAYQIVAKAMAAGVLARIRNGEHVDLAGIDISRDGAVCKKLMKREPIHITRDNFGACGLDGYNVRIIDKYGNKLLATSDNAPNALLLPYVLTTLFGG